MSGDIDRRKDERFDKDGYEVNYHGPDKSETRPATKQEYDNVMRVAKRSPVRRLIDKLTA